MEGCKSEREGENRSDDRCTTYRKNGQESGWYQFVGDRVILEKEQGGLPIMSVSLEDILIVHKIARKIAGYSDKQAEKEIGEHYRY